MFKVCDLLEELKRLPQDAEVKVLTEYVDGSSDVREVLNSIDAIKLEDGDVIIELG